MVKLPTSEIGGVARKVRKRQGMRLEDLADKNISPATISNIERGVPHVKQDKLIYLMEKLGISMDKLPDLILKEQKELDDLKFHLTSIESMKRMKQLDKALVRLDEIKLSSDHPYASTWHWLKGGCYLFKQKWRKAEKELNNAIRLSSENSMDNIEAYSFNDLSLCCYHQNDLQAALQYVNSGLDAFHPEGGYPIVKYLLHHNKAIYLERLERTAEALKIVQDIWGELPQLEQIETVLTFYWLRAELVRKSGALDEALKFAQKGIELASLNYNRKTTFDLWTVMGSIYMEKKNWKRAEFCFDIAMGIPKEYIQDSRYIRTCTQLGNLYIQQKKWERARNILNQAIQEAERLNNSIYLTDVRLVLGDYYYLKESHNEAISQFRQAVGLAQKYCYKDKEYHGWYRLARCWKDINEKEFQQCTTNMFRIQEEMKKK
ncbi:helix-turn-helix domain-containing protein [Paludifilum halophilum]|uniref:DNA-binding protein n=1 Tax=Paludifilum halophilum TaxID=1642702 RepID=A0A235B5J1_9BACL|nr:tetratricopeptide repeat protein [Paludifilum halophilum]OYD07502.1 DNA-binding protein [Paludifilum halophilum]